MSRPLVVLRPEPGNTRTVEAITAMGLTAISLPLFAVAPIAWTVPHPENFDALLLTSANAVRHGGAGLARLYALPVLAVGDATAAAARAAGFVVAATGNGGVDALLDGSPPARLLHLCGRERTVVADATATPVYAADPVPVTDQAVGKLGGCVVLVHSVRAATALAGLPLKRSTIRVAALGAVIAASVGGGWERVAAADRPDEAALLAVAAMLAD